MQQQHPFPVSITTSRILTGMNKAVLMNGKVSVSEAMHKLLRDDDIAAAERVARSIPLVNIGNFDPLKPGFVPLSGDFTP